MPTRPSRTPVRWGRRRSGALAVGLLVILGATALWIAFPNRGNRGSSTASPRPVAAPPPQAVTTARRMRVEVLAAYPHDPGAFTQGLLYDGDVLIESTGLEGQSTVRRVELSTGRVLRQTALAPELFGEGIAATPHGLVQLTWKNGQGFLYDPATLAVVRRFTYQGEGWGICYDGSYLVTSEGTEYLQVRTLEPFFGLSREVRVTMDGQPVPFLNELECVNGSVYANSWKADYLVRIDPGTGVVTERIDASGLLTAAEARDADVLNGIAYDPGDGTFLITGKRWPRLFRVRVVPAGS